MIDGIVRLFVELEDRDEGNGQHLGRQPIRSTIPVGSNVQTPSQTRVQRGSSRAGRRAHRRPNEVNQAGNQQQSEQSQTRSQMAQGIEQRIREAVTSAINILQVAVNSVPSPRPNHVTGSTRGSTIQGQGATNVEANDQSQGQVVTVAAAPQNVQRERHANQPPTSAQFAAQTPAPTTAAANHRVENSVENRPANNRTAGTVSNADRNTTTNENPIGNRARNRNRHRDNQTVHVLGILRLSPHEFTN